MCSEPATGGASWSTSGSECGLLGDLDEVSAGVVEHGGGDWPHGRGLLREADAKAAQSLVLMLDVLDAERCGGDTVLDQRSLERLRGRVFIGLEQQLDPVRNVGRDAVNQRCSPSGMSFFVAKPRTSV